ncbi:MAG: YihY/virulence factor BrkB family protein [Proteobacteria bacterium]|nr:YihY/virulence factor BrkB family protein [Pseudomonadota bacterium]
MSNYNAIYGSFAAIPLFVVWLQIGWMIVLFGCEVVFFCNIMKTTETIIAFPTSVFPCKKSLLCKLLIC